MIMKNNLPIRIIFTLILLIPLSISAQSWTMVNNNTIEIDACRESGGTIYDDGGPTADYSNNFDGIVILRASAGLTITLTGTYSTESCCDKLSVNDGSTMLLEEASGNGTVNLNSTSGQLVIHFVTDGSVINSGFELHWNVTGINEACANPVSGLDTTSVTPTSIGLSWTATDAGGPFTVICGDQTFTGITSTSHTITGLNPSSTYSISVVASAAAGNRCCADQIYVRTACGNSSLPYSEGFEGMAEGSFPSCWLQVVNFDDEDYLPQVVSTQHSSGSNSLLLSCGKTESSGHFGIVATPPLEGVGSHTVRLMMRASHYGTLVEFGTCDSAGSDYNQYGFTPIGSTYIYNTDQWQEYRFSWTSTGNGRRLAFRMQQHQQDGIARRLYIDDMGIENCGIDSVRTIHVEYDRLELLWSTYGNPTCNVGVRREGALTDTLSFSNVTSPLTILGLASDTRYTFTVYPFCSGVPSLSRNVTTRTPMMPTAADGYCSNFSQSPELPTEWTFQVIRNSCGGHIYKNGRNVHYYDGCGGAEAMMASERLLGLAGKQISVTYSGYNNNAMIIIGTMVHPDDLSTFVPLDTAYSDGGRHTITTTVPTASSGRHIALYFKNPSWYIDFEIQAVTCSHCSLEEGVVLHRRGTTIEFSWAQPYDTVLVQYGLRGFPIGSGTIDTFYNVTHGTIKGLTPNTGYDLFLYRPCQTPCEDMRYMRRTATTDYNLPYCENFENLDANIWYAPDPSDGGYADWQRLREINGRPDFSGQPYFGDAGQALVMSSWGFNWDYYSMTMLPDVEIDSSSILSFYVFDMAPKSTLIVGAVADDYDYQHFEVLDTIHINAHNKRVHYNYRLRPSDILFNRRLVLAYQHPYQYSYYNCYIDELQLQHHSYGTLQNTYTSFDTIHFNLTSLDGGADSVIVTLLGGSQTHIDTIPLADIHSFGFGGLDTGTVYLCYVRPLNEGCNSYAGYVITTSYGNGYGNCFPFSYELSDELPYHWAANITTLITTDEYLQLQPHGAVAMHPMAGLENLSFSFRARSNAVGDTLLLGSIPGDSISTDSTHFGPQINYFTPIDTFILGTDWQTYMLRMPTMSSDTVRLTFRAGNGITDLDEVEISWCPIVHFSIDGNSLICTLDDDRVTNYYLTLIDSTGNDSRIIFVENSNPFRINGLNMDMRYDLSWYCLYGESECRPTVSVRTGGLIPLPYCEDFNAGSGGSLSVPPTWTFVKNESYNTVSLDTWGPSLRMDPGNNRWMYAVMPELDVDSTLSLHCNFYSWTPGAVQIGVMNSATDTASFIPLWTPSNNDWQQPEVELSGYTNKRVAIRTRADMRLFNLHLYGYPLAKLSLIAHKHLKVTTEYPGAYWLHYRNAYNPSEDTLFYIDTTVFYIHDTNITSNDNVIINQCDSTGYTCESDIYYYLSGVYNLPYCYNEYCGGLRAFNYQPYGHSGVNECLQRQSNNNYIHRFYGNSSSWMVMHDLDIDSIKHAGMRIRYKAGAQSDSLVVGVMSNAYDTLSFTPLDTLVYTLGDDSLQSVYVDLTRYSDSGRWITFHHPYNPNSQWFDIHYVYLESCPGALSATASLSRWNRVKIDGQITPFFVEYGYSNQGQGHPDNVILRVDTVPIILTLNPETRYDFYFRCDSTNHSCVPKQQVTTLAAPMDLPACTNFDTVAASLIPHNWQRRNAAIGTTNAQFHSSPNSLQMPVASNSYLITPDINIDSIQKVTLSLWYQVEDLSDRLVIGVMSDPSDMSTFYPVRTLAPMETGTWQHGIVEFSHAPTESHFIALRARSNRQAGGRNIYVDDIYVATCAAFDFTVQRLTNNSIDLTWSHLGNPYITVTMEDDGVVANTYTGVTPPLHIEPLDMLHYYTFRFNSVCGSADTGYCSTNYIDSLSVVTPALGTGCVNPTDLASPQAVFYSGSYRNPYSQAGAINYGPLHPDSRHTVCYDTAQRDPRTGNQLRTIPEGYTSSVRLGNWSTNYFTPEAEGVIYSLLVDTNNFELLLLRYAAVLQDPQHATEDQPRFRMELLDTNYSIIDSACTSADFIADQNLGWHTDDDGVLWKDWTAVGVDLSAYHGQQVYFRLTTFDCNEGSHYGYAYFTLECMRKSMNTVSCGDVDSNTLSAPEGFHYRWYTSQSSATVSTNQSITVPNQNITYYCDVSKLDNPNCHFLISAYGGTRYPMASFDTSMIVDSCQFFVTFTNTSGVSNDGITLIPGEACETSHWDFGNGAISSNPHGYAVYTLPGTYTVRLISGIAFDACQDTATMTLVLNLPPGMAPSDTTQASICDNQLFSYYNETYTEAGTYYHNIPIPGSTCDSINVLYLEVRPTSFVDTAAMVCDSIVWHGATYTASADSILASIGLNSVLCDSILCLSLKVNPSYDLNDSIVICPNQPYLYEEIDYGGPIAFDSPHLSRFDCDSLVHVTLYPSNPLFPAPPIVSLDTSEWYPFDTLLLGCDPQRIFLRDTSISAYRSWSLWNINDTSDVYTASGRSFSPSLDTTSIFACQLITVSDEGCRDTIRNDSLLWVFLSPKASFFWSPSRLSIHNPEAQFYNQSLPDTCSFLWLFPLDPGANSYDSSVAVNPFYSWEINTDPDDYPVSLIAYWLQHGPDSLTVVCTDTATIPVAIVNTYLQFPNSVTPNGDGINDRWVIVNLLEMGEYSMNELWIYDRFGAPVYHVKNISKDSDFWDPLDTHSPDGTYYYRFTAKNNFGIVKRNGVIEVSR